jgi:hypothetical protein
MRSGISDDDLKDVSRRIRELPPYHYSFFHLAELLKLFVQCFVGGVPGKTSIAEPVNIWWNRTEKISGTYPMKSLADI